MPEARVFDQPVIFRYGVQTPTNVLDVTTRGVQRGQASLDGQGRRVRDVVAEAIEADRTLYFPGGEYYTDEPIHDARPYPRIFGDYQATVIRPDASDYPAIHAGTGTFDPAGVLGPGSSFVHNIRVKSRNETLAQAGLVPAFLFDGTIGIDFRNASAAYYAFGADWINNCYLSTVTNFNTDFDQCNVAMRLSGFRAGMPFAFGNDFSIRQSRLHGRAAGLWIDNLGGGIQLKDGQISGGWGAPAPSEAIGNIVIGIEFGTGVITGSNQGITLHGTSLEEIRNGSGILARGLQAFPNGISLLCEGVTFKAGPGAIRGWTITDGYDDAVSFLNCNAAGSFSDSQFCRVDNTPPGASRPSYFEVGWRHHMDGFVTLAGQPRRLTDLSPMMLANMPLAEAKSSYFNYNDGQLFQHHFSLYRRSINWYAQVINANFDGVGTWNPDAAGVTWINMP